MKHIDAWVIHMWESMHRLHIQIHSCFVDEKSTHWLKKTPDELMALLSFSKIIMSSCKMSYERQTWKSTLHTSLE